MQINNGFAIAVTGVRRGMESLDRNSAEIASASKGQGGDITAPLVDSKINQLQVEANVSVIRTLDEVLGTLLDEKA
jgi:hypothetical protein